MQDLEQSIRERAYQLWIEGGYQDGHAAAHWLTAQREILSTTLGEIGRVTEDRSANSAKSKKIRKKQRAA